MSLDIDAHAKTARTRERGHARASAKKLPVALLMRSTKRLDMTRTYRLWLSLICDGLDDIISTRARRSSDYTAR